MSHRIQDITRDRFQSCQWLSACRVALSLILQLPSLVTNCSALVWLSCEYFNSIPRSVSTVFEVFPLFFEYYHTRNCGFPHFRRPSVLEAERGQGCIGFVFRYLPITGCLSRVWLLNCLPHFSTAYPQVLKS